MHQSNLNFSKTQQVSITAESRVWLKKEKEKEKKEEDKLKFQFQFRNISNSNGNIIVVDLTSNTMDPAY